MSTENVYNNLDFCLNVLYDYVYNQNKKDCYIIKHIDVNKIQLKNIKKPGDFDSTEILTAKLKLIYQNKNYFIFKRYSETSYPVNLHIRLYKPENKNYSDMNRSELIDMKINYILSEIALQEVFPFILLPLMNFDVQFSNLLNLNNEITSVIKDHNFDEDSVFHFKITEHYFKLDNLENYLQNYLKNSDGFDLEFWQIFFYQILYSLFRIQEKYPNFRHNMLDLTSVFVYQTKKNIENLKEFKVKDTVFQIPDYGFEIKISDFSRSNIKNIADNKDIPTSLKKENQYYDVHYFFNSLYIFIKENGKLNSDLIAFFDIIIPEKYRSEGQDFAGLDQAYYESTIGQILTPMLILVKNNFFTKFIKKNIMVSETSNSPENIKSYNKKENSIDYSISDSITDDSDLPRLIGRQVQKKSKFNNNKTTGFRRLNRPNNNQNKKTTNYIEDVEDIVEEDYVDPDRETPNQNRFQNIVADDIKSNKRMSRITESLSNYDDDESSGTNGIFRNNMTNSSQYSNKNDQTSSTSSSAYPKLTGNISIGSTDNTRTLNPVKQSKSSQQSRLPTMTETYTNFDRTSRKSDDFKENKNIMDMDNLSESGSESSSENMQGKNNNFLNLFKDRVPNDPRMPYSQGTQPPKNNLFARVEELGKISRGQTSTQNYNPYYAQNFGPTFEQNYGQNREIYEQPELNKKSKKKKNKKRGDNREINNVNYGPQGDLLTKLPEGYEGMVPDWMQARLPIPGEGVMPTQNLPIMPQYNQMPQFQPNLPSLSEVPMMPQQNYQNVMPQMQQMPQIPQMLPNNYNPLMNNINQPQNPNIFAQNIPQQGGNDDIKNYKSKKDNKFFFLRAGEKK
ncbi:Protein kinase [uncultured virus]|nr:Protein kinase [uncultured virus]